MEMTGIEMIRIWIYRMGTYYLRGTIGKYENGNPTAL